MQPNVEASSVSAVCTMQPWGRSVWRILSERDGSMAVGHRLHLIEAMTSQSRDGLQQLHALRPRFVFFVGWSDYVRAEFHEKYECINFHCTALPFGRGGAPIENLIRRGVTETVVTAHRMVREVDAGPIYGARGPISLAGTKDEILQRFIDPVVALIDDILTTEPTPVPQVGQPTIFRRLPADEYEALWKERGHVVR